MAERYVIETTVASVEEKRRLVRAWKVGDETKTETETQGWFVHFTGSWESLFLGKSKPALEVGQRVRITIEAV